MLINNLSARKKSAVFLKQKNVVNMKTIKLLAITLLALFSFNLAGAQPKHQHKKHAHAHHKRAMHHHHKAAARHHHKARHAHHPHHKK